MRKMRVVPGSGDLMSGPDLSIFDKPGQPTVAEEAKWMGVHGNTVRAWRRNRNNPAYELYCASLFIVNQLRQAEAQREQNALALAKTQIGWDQYKRMLFPSDKG